MGESNLSGAGLIDKIQYAINNTDATIAISLLAWLNDRYFFILNESDEWPFLQTEDSTTLAYTDASAEATLPSDFRDVTLVYDRVNNRYLKRVALWKVRKNDPDLSDTADSPYGYYFPDTEGPSETMGIYPSLSSGSTLTLSLVYQKELTPLTDDSASYPLIPKRHRANVLMSGVIAEYYRWKGDFEKAAHYEMLFKQALVQMKVEQGVTKQQADESRAWRWDDSFEREELDDVY